MTLNSIIKLPIQLLTYRGLYDYKSISSIFGKNIDHFESINTYIAKVGINKYIKNMVNCCRYYKKAGHDPYTFITNPYLFFQLKLDKIIEYENKISINNIKSSILNYIQKETEISLLNNERNNINKFEFYLIPKHDTKGIMYDYTFPLRDINNCKHYFGFLISFPFEKSIKRFCVGIYYNKEIIAITEPSIKINPKMYKLISKIYDEHYRCE